MQKGFSNLIILLVVLVLAVTAGGYYYSQNLTSKVTPQTLSTPVPSTDPTTNWKTYNNSTFGYSFRYPTEYKNLSGLGEHVLYSPDAEFNKTTRAKTQGLEIGSTVYGPGEDIQNYIGPSTITDPTLASALKLPSGVIAKAYVNTEDVTVTIDYPKNNKIMRIMIWCGGEKGTADGCKKLLTPVLSTFKFTDQAQTTNTSTWKTYTNAQYGFSLNYPSQFTLKPDTYPSDKDQPFNLVNLWFRITEQGQDRYSGYAVKIHTSANKTLAQEYPSIKLTTLSGTYGADEAASTDYPIFYFRVKDKFFEINPIYQDSTAADKIWNYQILPTFKFTQ